eukprot:scaffold2991_cov66-Skeletonema_marinoi.AAC.2
MSDVYTLAYRLNLVCEGAVDEWVGIGISSDGLMQSVAVLGIPGNDVPLRYALNGKSADDVLHMPDQEQTLMGASLQLHKNKRTVMTFTKALEVDAGEEMYLLFARGMSPSLGYHADAERSQSK